MTQEKAPPVIMPEITDDHMRLLIDAGIQPFPVIGRGYTSAHARIDGEPAGPDRIGRDTYLAYMYLRMVSPRFNPSPRKSAAPEAVFSDVSVPAVLVFEFTVYVGEEAILDGLGNGTALARADGDFIHAGDGRQFGRGAGRGRFRNTADGDILRLRVHDQRRGAVPIVHLGHVQQALTALRELDTLTTAGGAAAVLSISPWRVHALHAEALLLDGQREAAWVAAELALGGGEPHISEQREWEVAAWIAVVIALEKGKKARSRELLQRLSAPALLTLTPELLAALPGATDVRLVALRSPVLQGVLWFQDDHCDWALELAHGLATCQQRPPAGDITEGPGPDLRYAAGGGVLPVPGVRFSPAKWGGELWYAAAFEPLVEQPRVAGIFSWKEGEPPRRHTRCPPGAVDSGPLLADGHLWYLRRQAGTSRLYRQEGERAQRMAPDLDAVSRVALMAPTGETSALVLAAVVDGAPTLRLLPVDATPDRPSEPLFSEPVAAWRPGWQR